MAFYISRFPVGNFWYIAEGGFEIEVFQEYSSMFMEDMLLLFVLRMKLGNCRFECCMVLAVAGRHFIKIIGVGFLNQGRGYPFS